MKARVVIGANFGDEGKGLLTDYLCSKGAGMVVRFNGGAQAGHTVVTPDGQRHVFRHIGSGALLGVPTFLSQFFVCNPILFFEELKQLHALGIKPSVYAHPDCLVTTFMDMIINQKLEDRRGTKRHGSCGIGFHETIKRSNVKELKLTMSDLWNDSPRVSVQMEEICDKYARFRTGEKLDRGDLITSFLKGCREFAQYVNPLGIGQCKDIVFEGAQGLLLDQNNTEFFPHVTHSNTGMENVRILAKQAGVTDLDIHYVSRTYLTRHGAGPLPGQSDALKYEDNTNASNQYQGTMRFAPLVHSELVERCREDAKGSFKLVLSHCDQQVPESEAHLYFDGPTREAVSTKRTILVS